MSLSSNPLVSIIIPCYNTARFVWETLHSAIAQSYQNIEVIVIDDGSTDNSEEVIKSVKDPRIRYVYQENQGLSAARNTGIRESKGELLTFLDADDLFAIDKIKIQVDFLQKSPETDIIACGFHRTNEQGKILYAVNPKEQKISIRDLLLNSQFPVHTALVKRSIIEKTGFFDTQLRAAEDWDYWCRSAMNGAVIYRISQASCTYRLLDNAMTSNAPRQTEMLRQVVEKNFSNPDLTADLKSLQSQAMETVLLTGAARCFVLAFYDEGNQYLQQALKLNPKISAQNFELLCKKVAGMMKHMNVKNPSEKATNIYDKIGSTFDMSPAFVNKIVFRTQLLKSKSPLKTILSQPKYWRFAYQMLLQRF